MKRIKIFVIVLLLLTFGFAKIPFDNNYIGLGFGISTPLGKDVLNKGAYQLGIGSQMNWQFSTKSKNIYNTLIGIEIFGDYSGGSYLTVPIVLNRQLELINWKFITLNGYAGLGYVFHQFDSATNGIMIKNQHTLGINGGFSLDFKIGSKWIVSMQTGLFKSFTKPVEIYFAGQSIKSHDKLNYTTTPLTINISRKF